MFSFCVIPYSARSSSFFDGVYEDGVRVCCNNDAIKAFAFSRVLSPSHDLLANINQRLLQGVHEGKNVMLILASSHCNCLAKQKEINHSSSDCEEVNFDACNNISASTSETSTMCIDLCLNIFTHLFDGGHCANASATVSMTTVSTSGAMVDELYLEQKSIDSITECTVKEINRTNAATQWAFILQRLQQRHTLFAVSQNKCKPSHRTSISNCEDKECNVTITMPSVCVITICFSHSGSVTIVDVDDDALVLEQLATVIAHKMCSDDASISSVQTSFTFAPERICSLERTTKQQNWEQDRAKFTSLLNIILSGKMHNRQYENSIDKYDVVHTVAFANPLISEDGTLTIMQFASQLNSSLLREEKVNISNPSQREKQQEESIQTYNSNDDNETDFKNECTYDKYWNKVNNCNVRFCQENYSSNNNHDYPSGNGNACTGKTNVESKEFTENISYHHSLPLTESPLSSLSPPPFVTQLSLTPNVNVTHGSEWEYNIYKRAKNDNESKCNADKSYNNARRTTQLLSPSPFLPSSSSTSFSSPEFLSHYQHEQGESNIANKLKKDEKLQTCVSNHNNDYNNKNYYNSYDCNEKENKENIEEISVHLDSDTNADEVEEEEEEVHNAGESNVKCQENRINYYRGIDRSDTRKVTNTKAHDANKTKGKSTELTTTKTKSTISKNQLLEELMQKTKRDLMELRQKYSKNNEQKVIHEQSEEWKPHELHELHNHSDQICKAQEEPNAWQARFMEHKLRLLEYERRQMQLSKETNDEDVATRESELRMLREKVNMLEKALGSIEEFKRSQVANSCEEANVTEHLSSRCLAKVVRGNNDEEFNVKICTSPPSPAAINPASADKSNFSKSRYNDIKNNNNKNYVNCDDNVQVQRETQFCEDADGLRANSKIAAAASATVLCNNPSLSYSSSVAMHSQPSISPSLSPSSLFPTLQTPSLSLSHEEKYDCKTHFNEQQEEQYLQKNLQERIAAIGIHELRRRNAELEEKISLLESEIKKREEHKHIAVNMEMQNNNVQKQHSLNQVNEENGVCCSANDANVCVTQVNTKDHKNQSHALNDFRISTQSIASTMLVCCQSLLEELHVAREKLYMSRVQVYNYHQPHLHRYQSEESRSQVLKKAVQLVDEHIRALHALKLVITNIANRQLSADGDTVEFATNANNTSVNDGIMKVNHIDRLFAFEEQRVRCFRNFLPIFVQVCTAAKYVKFRVLESRLIV